MANKDYYRILGVPRDAGYEDIKKKFRIEAKRCHPDLYPGDREAERRFKELQEAYEVLSDLELRQAYDMTGDPFSGNFGNPGWGGNGFNGGTNVNSLFQDYFNGGFAPRLNADARKKGASFELDIKITLKEAAKGLTKPFKYRREIVCPECDGTGAEPGTDSFLCPECDGSGKVRARTPQGGGMDVRSQIECQKCHGRGRIITVPCGECNGNGRIQVSAKASVIIPPGVTSGHRMCLRGAADDGFNGGEPGDVEVIIQVQPQEGIKVEGTNVISEHRVSIFQAMLGARLEAKTLDGPAKFRIPAGTQSGEEFVLEGKGYPDINNKGARGDHIAKIIVEIPGQFTAKQKEALRDFARAMHEEI